MRLVKKLGQSLASCPPSWQLLSANADEKCETTGASGWFRKQHCTYWRAVQPGTKHACHAHRVFHLEIQRNFYKHEASSRQGERQGHGWMGQTWNIGRNSCILRYGASTPVVAFHGTFIVVRSTTLMWTHLFYLSTFVMTSKRQTNGTS